MDELVEYIMMKTIHDGGNQKWEPKTFPGGLIVFIRNTDFIGPKNEGKKPTILHNGTII